MGLVVQKSPDQTQYLVQTGLGLKRNFEFIEIANFEGVPSVKSWDYGRTLGVAFRFS